MNRLYTRSLIKHSMREHGWIRMHSRPKDRQEVVVAREWLDKRDGRSDQFLTAAAIYDAKTDAFELCCMDRYLGSEPAKSFHWWMESYTPVDVWTHLLVAADWWRRGPLYAN